MVPISKEEATIIRAKYPNACIAATRHKRYVEGTERYLALIPDNLLAVQEMRESTFDEARRKAKYSINNIVKNGRDEA